MQMGTDRKEFGVTINLSKGSLSTKVEVYSRVSGKETNLLRESSLTMGKLGMMESGLEVKPMDKEERNGLMAKLTRVCSDLENPGVLV